MLDIGGVGAIQHDLAAAGVGQVVGVDASSAYLQLAQAEAERQSYAISIAGLVYGKSWSIGGQPPHHRVSNNSSQAHGPT